MTISVDMFFLRPDAQGTLQMQIRQFVAQGILAGRFPPGARLPSSRRLAAHLGVSRITVAQAYADLVADDYLSARGRSGFYVSENAPRPHEIDPPPAAVRETVDWARLLGPRTPSSLRRGKPRNWRDFRYPFVYGQADPTLFDQQNWRACLLMASGARDFHAMTDDRYEEDDPLLVEYIARHTLPRRGILARPEEILLTLGAQNALWLAATTLLADPRRCAAIEEPGYPALRDILRQLRCRVLPVATGAEGLSPGAVPRGVDVLFCTPSHHCPTGATMPLLARRQLLEAAEAGDCLIVEDDYEFEIAEGRAPLPALKSLDTAGRVIHVGSFSKSLFPGLRLGFLVGPAPFIAAARDLRATVLRHPPGLIQRAAAHFLSLGHYDALLRRIQRAFRERREVMLRAVAEHGLQPAGETAPGGSSLWMRAPEGTDTEALARRLREASVLIEPGRPFFGTPQAPGHYYRIAYSSIPSERIPEGIARIAAALRAG